MVEADEGVVLWEPVCIAVDTCKQWRTPFFPIYCQKLVFTHVVFYLHIVYVQQEEGRNQVADRTRPDTTYRQVGRVHFATYLEAKYLLPYPPSATGDVR